MASEYLAMFERAIITTKKLFQTGQPVPENDFTMAILKALGYPDTVPAWLLVLCLWPVPPAQFWKFFLASWPMCENTWQDREKVLGLLRQHAAVAPRPAFGGLLTLYRGCLLGRAKNISWTADRERAVWFMNRFAGAGRISTAIYAADAPSDAIFAGPLNDREEEEYLVDPAKLRSVRIVER